MTLLQETQLVEKIRDWCKSSHQYSTMIGIGDDAAAVQVSGRPVTFCSDLTIEGTHFDLRFSKFDDIAYKGFARVLSDLAAMAAMPLGCTISIAIPNTWTELEREKNLELFYRGALAHSLEFQCPILGGDLSTSKGPLVIDFAAIGEARPASSLWTRSAIRPGDQIYVTGKLGGAAFALEELQAGRRASLSDALLQRHLRPKPRLDVATRLAPCPISGAIDISDGLLADLSRACRASYVTPIIEETAVPIHEGASLRHALHGGDDYELLLFLPESWHACDYAQGELRQIGAKRIGHVEATKETSATL